MADRKYRQIWLWALLVILVGGGVFSVLRYRAGQGVSPLFGALPVSLQPEDEYFPKRIIAKRWRWVYLDPKGLDQLREKGSRFELNLFPDLAVTGVVGTHKTHQNGGQSVIGHLEDDPWDSTVILTRGGEIMKGVVLLGDGRQVLIDHVKDHAYVVLEVDPLKLGGCGTCEAELAQRREQGDMRLEKKPKKSAAAGDLGALTRRFAMAHSTVPTAACGHALNLPAEGANTRFERYRPMLAALGVPRPVLAAAGQNTGTYGLHGPGSASTINVGPTTPAQVRYTRQGTVEYIDIMFLCTDALVTQEGGYGPMNAFAANVSAGHDSIQTQVTLMLDTVNQIFEDCLMPLEVRQATHPVSEDGLWVAEHRAMTAMGDIQSSDRNLVASGYPEDAPAWEQVTAPVRQDKSDPDYKLWTVWRPRVNAKTGWNQKQAKVGVYRPKMAKIATNSVDAYLQWLTNRNNSLLRGDQYWKAGNYKQGSYIQYFDINATLNNASDPTQGRILDCFVKKSGPQANPPTGNDDDNDTGWVPPADGTPYKFHSGSPGSFISHNPGTGLFTPITVLTTLYFAGTGNETFLFNLHSTKNDAINRVNPVIIDNSYPDPPTHPMRALLLEEVDDLGNIVYSQEPYINFQTNVTWRLEPADAGLNRLYYQTPNRNLLTGPVDNAISNSEDLADRQPSHQAVERYEYDITDPDPITNMPGEANGTKYGSIYNPDYLITGILGLRMDLNGTDYSSREFNGSPILPPQEMARYPNLHRFTEDPFVAGALPDEPRADLVVLLTENLAGNAGIANKYVNIIQDGNIARAVGRGAEPYPNRVQERTFDSHEGDLTPPYNLARSFTDLPIVELASGNSTDSGPTGLVAYWPFDGNASDFSGNGHHGTAASGAPIWVTDRNGTLNGAISLNGATHLTAALPTSFNFNATTSWSITGWVKPNDYSAEGGLISQWNTTGNNSYYQFGVRGNRLTSLADPLDPVNTGDIGHVMGGADEWKHLAYIYDRKARGGDGGVPPLEETGSSGGSGSGGGSGSSAATITSIAAGNSHGLFLKSDGSIWAVGWNAKGQLGDGTTTDRNNWVQIMASGVKAVDVGFYHSLFLKTDGSLWGMGSNEYGELGTGDTTARHSPVQIVSSGVVGFSAGGHDHSLFIKDDGSLWALGRNNHGQLGDGTIVDRHLPVKVVNSGVVSVVGGGLHSVFIKDDGSLWAMGKNDEGQLGAGDWVGHLNPTKIVDSGVVKVSTLYDHTVFIKNDGSLWGVGENLFGQLGQGDNSNRNVPVLILASGVKDVSSGGGQTLVVKTDGTLWVTGKNDFGQLGLGDTTHRNTLNQIVGITNVSQVSAGGYHSLFIKTGNSIWAMGSDNSGCLGNGPASSANVVSPEKIETNVAPPNGLVAYYPFTGNANDASGNGNNGNLGGGDAAKQPTATTDRFGNANSAYSFDGVNDYILGTNNLPDTNQTSISVWIQPQSDRYSAIFYDAVGLTPGRDTQLVTDVGNDIQADFSKENSPSSGSINVPGVLQIGNWYHVVLTLGPTNSKLYLNGALISTSPVVSHNMGYHSLPHIGAANHGAGVEHWFHGKIDDLAIYDRTLSHTEVAQLYSAESQVADGTAKWAFDALGTVYTSPAIGPDGTIYIGSHSAPSKKTYAIHSNGTKKWEFPTSNGVYSSPAVGPDGTIYIGDRNNRMYAINPDGSQKWAYVAATEIFNSPAIGSDGTIYFSEGTTAIALNGSDGTKKWGLPLNAVNRDSSPAVGSDGTVYYGGDVFKALDGKTGAIKWSYNLGAGVSSMSSPAIGSDGTVYFGALNSKVYALDGRNGNKLWDYTTGGGVKGSPVIGTDGTIYIGSSDNKFYALHSNGTKKWEFNVGGDVQSAAAIGSDDILYVGVQSGSEKLYALHSNGTKAWEKSWEAGRSSPAVGPDGTVYVGGGDPTWSGTKYLIALSSSSRGLANSPWPKFGQNNQNTGRNSVVTPVVWAGKGKIKRYVNGVFYDEIGMNNATGEFNGTEFVIGKDPILNKYFNGSLDDVRVYDRAITMFELGKIYEGEKPDTGFTPNDPNKLVLHYPFSRHPFPTMFPGYWKEDMSPNANHGTGYDGANATVPDRYANPMSALKLDGVDSYFRTDSTTNFPRGGQPFTYSAWIKPGKLLAPDTRLDLVVGNDLGHDSRVWINDGNGSMRSFVGDHSLPGSNGNATKALKVADLNGDGLMDIVTGNWLQPTVAFLNTGNGKFVQSWQSQDGNKTRAIVLADVNGDNKTDLLVGRDDNASNLMYVGLGDGTFQEPPILLDKSATLLPNDQVGLIAWYSFNPNGSLMDSRAPSDTPQNDANSSGSPVITNRTGRYDPDKAYNLAPGDGIDYIESLTSNGFPNSTYDFTVSTWVKVSSFFGADGKPDIVEGVNGGVNRIYPGYGNGSFMPKRTFGNATRKTTGLALIDVDGDGDKDLLESAYDQPNQLRIFDKGIFGSPTDLGGNTPTHTLIAADVDADGDNDVVFGNNASQQDELWVNDGTGAFTLKEQILAYRPINPIPVGAVTHLPFDGATAQDIAQEFVSGVNGTVNGAFGASGNTPLAAGNMRPTTNRFGVPNRAVEIHGNGADIRWNAAGGGALHGNATNNLTVTFWMKPMGSQTGILEGTFMWYGPPGAASTTATRPGYWAITGKDNNASGDLQFSFNDRLGSRNLGRAPGLAPEASDPDANRRNWIFVAYQISPDGGEEVQNLFLGTFPGGTPTLQTCGNKTNNVWDTNISLSQVFFIGNNGGTKWAHAAYDDMRIYNKKLTNPELLQLLNESPYPVPLPKGDTRALALANLDASTADLEMVVGLNGNLTAIYQKNKNPEMNNIPWLQTAQFGLVRDLDGNNSADTRSVAVADFNGTGLGIVTGNHNAPDRVFMSKTGADWVYNNGLVMSAGSPLSADANATVALAMGRINNDIYQDVVTAQAGTTDRFYAGLSYGNFTAVGNIDANVNESTAISIGDLDGDGDQDLVYGFSNTNDKVFLGDGNGNFAAGIPLPESTGNTTSLHMADVVGSGQQVIFANRGVGQFELRLNASDLNKPNNAIMGFYTGGDDTTPKLATPNLIWQKDRWYHVIVKRENNTSLVMYRDGIELARGTVSQGNNAADLRVALGYRPADDMMALNGGVDDFRLYDRALADIEVASLHTIETPYKFARDDGLMAHYSFNNQTAEDLSLQLNHGAFGLGSRVPSQVTDRLGNPGQAISLDGVDDIVEVNAATAGNFTAFNFDDNTSFTVSAWVKPRDITRTNWLLNYGNSTGHSYRFGFENSKLISSVPSLNPDSNGSLGVTLTHTGQDRHIVMSVERTGDGTPYQGLSMPKSGLVAHYPFNNNADDQSGNGNHGTVTGATPTIDRHGNANSAYSFDGVDDYIDLGNRPDFNFGTSDFSISFWAKATGTQEDKYVIGKYFQNERPAYGVGTFGPQTRAYAFIADNQDVTPIASNGDITWEDNAWHHIVAVYDRDGNLYLYQDGSLRDSDDITSDSGSISNARSLLVGKIASGQYFGGKIDDIAIYNRALSAGEVATLNLAVASYDTQKNKPALFARKSPQPSGLAEDKAPANLAGDRILAKFFPEQDAAANGAAGKAADKPKQTRRELIQQAFARAGKVEGHDHVLGGYCKVHGPIDKGKHQPKPSEYVLVPKAQKYPQLKLGSSVIKPRIRGRLATYRGLFFPGDRQKPEASARAFLAQVAGQLFMKKDLADLKLLRIKHGLGSSQTHFQQSINGIPVLGATLTVSQGPDGGIQTLNSQYFARLQVPANKQPAKKFADVLQAAKDATGVKGKPFLPAKDKLYWYPQADGTAKLVYETLLTSPQAAGDFYTLIDANSGEILLQNNRTKFGGDGINDGTTGTGLVYVPNPWQTKPGPPTGVQGTLVDNSDAISADLTAQRKSVTLKGLDGTGQLVGEFVDLASFNSVTAPMSGYADANEATLTFNYDRNDARFEQVVVYHAIDSVQRYFHTLGFDDDNGLPNGLRDRVTRVCAHWDNVDNSFYTSGNDNLHMGDGGVDDAEDADIVIHEYGHAVLSAINNFSLSGADVKGSHEWQAIHEGFGDYLAATFYADKGDPGYLAGHAAAVGEWDMSMTYPGKNPPNLRRVDGAKNWNTDWINGFQHDNGEIFTAACWRLRQAVGGPTADRLIFEGLLMTPAASQTMNDVALLIHQADINLTGGVNSAAIQAAFNLGGITVPTDWPAVPPPPPSSSAPRETVAIRTYIDGKLYQEIELALPDGNFSGTALLLGVEETNQSYFDGEMDEVRIYDRALSPGEVAQLYQMTPVWIPTDTRAMVTGDMDRDGDLDIFVANYDQQNMWFENDGNGSFLFVRFVDVYAKNKSTAIDMAPINLDDLFGGGVEYPDLVIANDGQQNTYFEAYPGGKGFINVEYVDDNEAQKSHAVKLFDVDGDGDFDAVFGNHNASNSIYINGAPKPQPKPGEWVRDIGSNIYFPPAITADGTIIGGSNSGTLYALRPDNTVRWTFTDAGAQIRSTPAIALDGTIYVGTLSNALIALDPSDGTVLWRYTATSGGGATEGMRSPGIAADGTIYIGSTADDHLYAVDPNRYLTPGLPRGPAPYFEVLLTQAAGDHKWRYDSGDKIWGSPAIAPDGTIYVGSDDRGLHALNPADGSRKWRFNTGGEVYSSPALASDGTIYFGSRDTWIYAITDGGPGNSTQKWRFDTGGDVRSSPVIGVDGTVYCGSNDGKVYAFTDDGPGNFTKKWEYDTGSTVWAAPSIADDDTIVVGAWNQNLYALNDNGNSTTVAWSRNLGSQIFAPVVVGEDGTVYAGTQNGEIHTVHTTSTGLADSDWPKFRQNYRNTGRVEPSPPPPSGKQFSPFGFLSVTDTNNTNALAIVDFNGDGDLDVAVGDAGAVNKFYLNGPATGTNGTGNFTLGPPIIDGIASDTVDLAVVDMAADKRVLLANQKLNHHAIHLDPQDGNQTGKLQYFTGGNSTHPACEMAKGHQWTEGDWHHLVITRKAPPNNEVAIYVDGLQMGASKVPLLGNGAVGPDMEIDMGYRNATQHYPFIGAIDDVRIYDEALTHAEVVDLYEIERVDGGVVDPVAGIVAWWKLDNSADDSAGVYNLHGTPINVTSASDRLAQPNGAYEFNANAAINMGNSAVLNAGNSTISLWVGPPATGALTGTLISKGTTGNNHGWKLDLSAGKVQFHTSSNGTLADNDILAGATAIDDGKWHHVVAELSSGEKRIYIDGQLDAVKSYSKSVFATPALCLLGADNMASPTALFNGRLDEVRFYNTPLNAPGVEALYQLEQPGNLGQATVTVNFGPDVVSSGDSARLELFADTDTTQVPFKSWELNGTGATFTSTFAAAATANAWQNLRGAWKVTCLSGTMTVDNVVIRVKSSLGTYEVVHRMNRVPSEDIYGFNAQMNRDVFYGAVLQLTAANAGYTFAHELGHLLSGSHGIGDDVGIEVNDASHTFSPYGSTYNYVRDEFLSMGNHFSAWGSMPGQANNGTFGQYCTIMAYPGTAYTRISRYSSPLVYYRGTKTGDHHDRYLPPPFGEFDQPLYLDNGRAMTTIGFVSSLYRDSNGTNRTPPSATVPYEPPRGIPDGALSRAREQDEQSGPKQVVRNRPIVGPGSRTSGRRGQGIGSGGTPGGGVSPGIGGKTKSNKPGNGGTGTSGQSGSGNTQSPTRPSSPVAPRPGGGNSSPPPRPIKPGTGTSPPGGTRPNATKPGTSPGESPVPNDNLEGSFVLQLRASPGGRWLAVGTGHNRGATAGQGETAGVQSIDGRQVWHGRSVWWMLQAPGAGNYEIDASTDGSAIDTTLSVVRPGVGTSSNDNDRRQPTPASRVLLRRVSLKQGDKVYFSVDGVNGAQGVVKLTVKLRKLN